MPSLIGNKPNQVPTNGDLGKLAFMDNLDSFTSKTVMDTDITNIAPSLNLDFANSKVLDPRITFTRASTATFYNGTSSAVAEQNLLLQSQALATTWSQATCSVTVNSIVAPDGTTTGATLTSSNSTANNLGIFQNSSSTVAGTTLSMYFKAGTSNFVGISTSSTNIAVWANFNLSTGAVASSAGCTASIVSVGSGWYRCIMANTALASNGFVIIAPKDADPSANPWFNGTCASGNTIYAWGAQLEQRSAATAYTRTTTDPITNYIPTLQTAASGVARFDHNPITGESLGLLIEEQRANLSNYSEQFNDVAWTKGASSIVADTLISPSGTLTAEKLVPDSSANSHTVGNGFNATSGTSYTVSAYFKAGEYGCSAIALSGAIATTAVSINLSTGVASTGTGSPVNVTSTSVGNGWWRLSFSVTATSTTLMVFNFYAINGTTWADRAVAGNGFSGIFIWGAQAEAGAFATSYIPTVASQVTRSLDAASMTGTNFSSWYNQQEGTVYCEANPFESTGSTRYFYGINDNTGNNVFGWFKSASSYGSVILTNGVSQGSLFVGTATANVSAKTALSYKFNDAAFTANGGTVSPDSSVIVPVVNQLTIGAFTGTSSQVNCNIKKLSYYPRRLSNEELREMTA
jgi:hypothetical protein